MEKSTNEQAIDLIIQCLNLPGNTTIEELAQALSNLSKKDLKYLKNAFKDAMERDEKFRLTQN